MMFERLKRLYVNNRIDVNGLVNAVKKRLITEDQFFVIYGIMYDEVTGNKAGEGDRAPQKVVNEDG